MTTPTLPTLLVLCTGNSARSQMAEALFRRHLGDRFQAASAGTQPADRVHPLALEVLAEEGFDTSGLRPQHVDEYYGKVSIETAVIVCDSAARECPSPPPGARERLVWPFEDPAAATGSAAERKAKFREVYAALEARILAWKEELSSQAETEPSATEPSTTGS